MGRRSEVVGIDPDRAEELAAVWAETAIGIAESHRNAVGVAEAMLLPGPGVGDDRAAAQLARLATALRRRVVLVRALDRGVDAGVVGAIGWAPAGPSDGPDDLWSWLLSGGRTELLMPLTADDETWARSVGSGTIWTGPLARTYAEFEPIADGVGVVVVDFFIPFDSSGGLVGDDRDHDEPLFGSIGDDDSRVVMALDLETGRAAVQFHESCLLGGLVCRRARPVVLDDRSTGPLPDVHGGEVNVVTLDSDGSELTISYDILNSITPIGSTDGTFTLRDGGGGVMVVSDVDADEYPSVGVYQYRAPDDVRILRRHHSADMYTVFPIVPPSLADDLPDRAPEFAAVVLGPAVAGFVAAAQATLEDWFDPGIEGTASARPG